MSSEVNEDRMWKSQTKINNIFSFTLINQRKPSLSLSNKFSFNVFGFGAFLRLFTLQLSKQQKTSLNLPKGAIILVSYEGKGISAFDLNTKIHLGSDSCSEIQTIFGGISPSEFGYLEKTQKCINFGQINPFQMESVSRRSIPIEQLDSIDILQILYLSENKICILSKQNIHIIEEDAQMRSINIESLPDDLKHFTKCYVLEGGEFMVNSTLFTKSAGGEAGSRSATDQRLLFFDAEGKLKDRNIQLLRKKNSHHKWDSIDMEKKFKIREIYGSYAKFIILKEKSSYLLCSSYIDDEGNEDDYHDQQHYIHQSADIGLACDCQFSRKISIEEIYEGNKKSSKTAGNLNYFTQKLNSARVLNGEIFYAIFKENKFEIIDLNSGICHIRHDFENAAPNQIILLNQK